MGGLDHQIEHHLFLRYPHTIYRHLAYTIEEFCRDNRINYGRHQSLRAAMRAHYRWLRQMGRRPVRPDQRLNMIRLECIVYRIADGKVAESTAYINWLDMSKSAWST